MSLIYNGTDVKNIIYNGTTLSKIIYNGVEVYTSKITIISGGSIVQLASGSTSLSDYFGGSQGGKTTTIALYLNNSLIGRKVRMDLNYSVYNSIFNGVSNARITVNNGSNTIFSNNNISFVNYQWTNYSKRIDFTISSTTISITMGANKVADPDQYTQSFQYKATINNLYTI